MATQDTAQDMAPGHDYHLVKPSAWPIIGAIAALVTAIGGAIYMRGGTFWVLLIGLTIVAYTMFGWWRDVAREANTGDHTPVVMLHHRYGMILFIASEVMFFVAWFWAYFDAAFFFDEAGQVARVVATGGQWPPVGVEIFNPWHLPLFNTIILLTSGTTITWAHHSLLNNDRAGLKWGLAITVLLGMLFTYIQAYEYASAGFAFAGNIYGATFFMATGFHGLHVIIGTIFLLVCLIRAMRGRFTPERHLGLEFAAWYWHFVDVVWLFLFASIYVWASIGVAGL
jgi:cytochrome c oxidase subunit III